MSLSGRRLKLLLLAVVALGAARALLTAVRTFRYEKSTYTWPRVKPQRPEWPELRDAAFGKGVRAWYAPPRNGAVVIFVHGKPANRAEQLPAARALFDRGFGALLVDMPGWGESEGAIDWGEPSRQALRAAIGFAAAQPGVQHLGLYGFSMGTTVASLVAADEPRVEAVVLAAAFPDEATHIKNEFSRWGPLTAWSARLAAQSCGQRFDGPSTIDGAPRIAPRPLLLVVGAEDRITPLALSRKIFEAAREPKQLLIVAGAAHGDYERTGPRYHEQLAAFFTAALLHR